MGRDSGRSGKPGNVKGASRPIGISMKNPKIHQKLQKSK